MVRKDPAFSDFMVYDGITHGIRRYFIHDKCTKHEKDEELKKACVSERVDSIDDLIWLSDVSSGEIYNNRHCAACHGVKEWRSWRIRTSSQNILRANFSNLADAIMSDECSIINELPEDEEKDAEKFRCFLLEVSVCNETGLWKQYDAAIEAACLQYYNVPFIQYEPAHHVIYKNVFCFICNQGESYLADEICSWRVISKSNVDSFTALIDFEAVQRTMKTAAERCAWDDIYDKYTVRFYIFY